MVFINQSEKYVRTMCAILFSVFCFLYLYFFQADLMALTQHVLSEGQTTYDKTPGAIIVTCVLMLLQVFFSRAMQLTSVFYALTYVPSFISLMALTGIRANGGSYDFGAWGYALPISLLLCIACIPFSRKRYKNIMLHQIKTSTKVLVNVSFFLLMFLLTCSLSDSSTKLHKQLKAERLLMSEDYDNAIETVRSYDRPDNVLTAIGAYALSQKGLLADKLFTLPLAAGAESLLPARNSMTMFPSNRIFNYVGVCTKQDMSTSKYIDYVYRKNLGKKPFGDYYLCSLLMDKKLDKFVSCVTKYYNLKNPLPTHYREALLLYTHLRSNPKIIYQNSVMEADFQDFQSLEDKYKNTTERRNMLCDVYGNTYWFYYFYIKPGNGI